MKKESNCLENVFLVMISLKNYKEYLSDHYIKIKRVCAGV